MTTLIDWEDLVVTVSVCGMRALLWTYLANGKLLEYRYSDSVMIIWENNFGCSRMQRSVSDNIHVEFQNY